MTGWTHGTHGWSETSPGDVPSRGRPLRDRRPQSPERCPGPSWPTSPGRRRSPTPCDAPTAPGGGRCSPDWYAGANPTRPVTPTAPWRERGSTLLRLLSGDDARLLYRSTQRGLLDNAPVGKSRAWLGEATSEFSPRSVTLLVSDRKWHSCNAFASPGNGLVRHAPAVGGPGLWGAKKSDCEAPSTECGVDPTHGWRGGGRGGRSRPKNGTRNPGAGPRSDRVPSDGPPV